MALQANKLVRKTVDHLQMVAVSYKISMVEDHLDVRKKGEIACQSCGCVLNGRAGGPARLGLWYASLAAVDDLCIRHFSAQQGKQNDEIDKHAFPPSVHFLQLFLIKRKASAAYEAFIVCTIMVCPLITGQCRHCGGPPQRLPGQYSA